MKIHVICCNDSVEYAVVGDEKKAQVKMAELSDRNFETNKSMFKNREEYNNTFFWHIHKVNGE